MTEFAVGLLLVVIGAVLGTVGTIVVQNWNRIVGRLPLDVVIEPDPGVFLAGEPNWDDFAYVFPSAAIEEVGHPPSEVCREWYSWARDRGGVSARVQRVQVILVPSDDTTVLVEALVPHVLRSTEAIEGTHVACPVGGADGTVRHIEVDLNAVDAPFTTYRAEGEGEPVKPFKSKIGAGDAERFEIHAVVPDDLFVEWRGDLHLIANGRKFQLSIDNDGQPFHVTGTGRSSSYLWELDRWAEFQG